MSEEEFFEWLKTHDNAICDKLVRIRYKYSWEKEWTYSNEILQVYFNSDRLYEWLDDWNEGQEQVEILGCVDIDNILIECFENLGKGVISDD